MLKCPNLYSCPDETAVMGCPNTDSPAYLPPAHVPLRGIFAGWYICWYTTQAYIPPPKK